jgi:hypothetical protein
MDGVCWWCSGSLWPPYYSTTTFTLAISTQIILFSKMLKIYFILFYFILFPPNENNFCARQIIIEFVRIFYLSNWKNWKFNWLFKQTCVEAAKVLL